jgi:hypothetical protein
MFAFCGYGFSSKNEFLRFAHTVLSCKNKCLHFADTGFSQERKCFHFADTLGWQP